MTLSFRPKSGELYPVTLMTDYVSQAAGILKKTDGLTTLHVSSPHDSKKEEKDDKSGDAKSPAARSPTAPAPAPEKPSALSLFFYN